MSQQQHYASQPATSTASFRTVQIPCCLCGTNITPNAANQCAACLAQQFNLSEKMQHGPGGAPHSTVYQCRQCRRYQKTEKLFIHAEPESPELLALCLKQIPALNSNYNTSNHSISDSSPASGGDKRQPPIHLVDAGFIWTEPHSMRHRLKLTVRTELYNVQVQQRVMVELHNAWKQCSDCKREYTNRTWTAVVQLRQAKQQHSGEDEKKKSKRGLAALEMALAKSPEIRKHVLKIDSTKNGFDFYFLTLPHAQTFSSYIQRIAPMRVKTSKKLVSTDSKNNTAHVKHTVTCDMVPLCRDDLILIHKSILKGGGRLAGRLSVVTKVSSVIHLVDGSPKRENLLDAQAEISPETYYKNEKYIKPIQAAHRLVRFVVLDVELCDDPNKNVVNNEESHDDTTVDTDSTPQYRGPDSGVSKYALADVLVARESDFGVNDITYSVVTHLGHLLKAGDICLGYDLETTVGVAADDQDWGFGNTGSSPYHNSFVIPDVILVRKVTEKRNDNNQTPEDHDVDEAEAGTKKKKVSKRKERKRRKEGKKMRELEEHAARMGFLDDDDDDDVDERDHGMEEENSTLDDELANDPELAAQLASLEKELAALGDAGKDSANEEATVEPATDESVKQGQDPSE